MDLRKKKTKLIHARDCMSVVLFVSMKNDGRNSCPIVSTLVFFLRQLFLFLNICF